MCVYIASINLPYVIRVIIYNLEIIRRNNSYGCDKELWFGKSLFFRAAHVSLILKQHSSKRSGTRAELVLRC